MVAIAGAGWKLAPSLVRLVNDVDARYPNRNRASDGSIGDLAHAARSSFHNPQDGFVDALDLTHDPDDFDAHAYARGLVARPPYWMDHVISNGQIASRKSIWKWSTYTGTNPHKSHVHFAVQRNTFGRTSPAPWFPEAEDDMTPEEHQLLKDIHAWMSADGKPMAMRVAANQAELNDTHAKTIDLWHWLYQLTEEQGWPNHPEFEANLRRVVREEVARINAAGGAGTVTGTFTGTVG